MAAKVEQIQREHLTDEDWANFCRFMEVTVRLKAHLIARRGKGSDK
ncbi:hypothetical protein KP001_16335 [Geomonas subterranea]|uniref:MarR family transcriptional regulator n=1 Tax=Geomonas subterranea TaxID=2847989 RepID=A0ABX8LEV5_9BACT|nr:hypothetical protein [Geomonas subterranea]QXE89974.1 hypothetical protein KP001_16335 [Geomonas subterranea]QXM07906.1 hypothetical protein KP002_12945 [Geomonas subterranea]